MSGGKVWIGKAQSAAGGTLRNFVRAVIHPLVVASCKNLMNTVKVRRQGSGSVTFCGTPEPAAPMGAASLEQCGVGGLS